MDNIQTEQKEIVSTNGATQIADLVAQVLQPSSSGDKEILDVVARYSLQINPAQQLVLNKLFILSEHPEISKKESEKIKMFVATYMDTKRYHDSLPFISRTIEALALKRFWSSESMKGQIIRQDK